MAIKKVKVQVTYIAEIDGVIKKCNKTWSYMVIDPITEKIVIEDADYLSGGQKLKLALNDMFKRKKLTKADYASKSKEQREREYYRELRGDTT